MPMMAIGLLVTGPVIIVLLAVLAQLTRLIAHREQDPTITEAQARENAAPLRTAILALNGCKPERRD